MLEYIEMHLLVDGGNKFVISTDVMLKNRLIVQTLEEAGCITRLGRLNLATQARFGRAFGRGFIRRLHDQALHKLKKVKCPWGHWLWEVNTTRFDQMNPQILLSRPLLEQVEKRYGKEPQVRLVGEDDTPTHHAPWRIEPV